MRHFNLFLALILSLTVLETVYTRPLVSLTPRTSSTNEWSMFGGTISRNMANLQDKLPRMPLKEPDWKDDLATKQWEADWLLWKTDLGSRNYTQPVVAGGKVFVGTNNDQPRNSRDQQKNADGEIVPINLNTLMCFDTKSGKFLWQAVHDMLPNSPTAAGVCSTPSVVGDRVYYVSAQFRVICLDVNGFANGNQGIQTEKYKDSTDADFIWEYDLINELNVSPHNMGAICQGMSTMTSTLIVGELLFVTTGNGVDESHRKVSNPNAPSFICLNRHTGKLVWKDNSPGKKIMHGQWASPAYASEPIPQVIFPGGDGWLRAFDPPTGKLIWKFDCNPKHAKYDIGGIGRKCDFIAAPVIYDKRLYIGTGQDPEHYVGQADLWSIDLKKAVEGGKTNPDYDVSPEIIEQEKLPPKKDVDSKVTPKSVVDLAFRNLFELRDIFKDEVEIKNKLLTKANPVSAVAWHYGGTEDRPFAPREFKFGRTMSTMCIVDDVLYASELEGHLHCLDAKTGKHYWKYDLKSIVWGSPVYVDDKVLIATEDGDVYTFRHEKKQEVFDDIAVGALQQSAKLAKAERVKMRTEFEKKYLISKIEMDSPIRSTPTVANRVLYLATEKSLYAFGSR